MFKEVQNYIIMGLIGGAATLYFQVQNLQVAVDVNKTLRKDLCAAVIGSKAMDKEFQFSICVGGKYESR